MAHDKEIARWQKTVSGLRSQQDAAETRIVELSETKRPLTLAAHTGDEGAKSNLDKLNDEMKATLRELIAAMKEQDA